MAKSKKNHNDSKPLIIKLNILETINLNNEYDLRIVSFCLAYNDLWHTSKEMLLRSSKKYVSYRMYLLKQSIAHLREAYWLLHKSFLIDKEISLKLKNIEGVHPLFQEILNKLNGSNEDSFAKKVLFPSRNLTWHYSFDNKSDKEILKQIAKEMDCNNVLGQIIIGENTGNTYFEFADSLFISTIVTLGENYGLNQKEYFTKLSSLIVDVLKLLDLIISDYLTNNSEVQGIIEMQKF